MMKQSLTWVFALLLGLAVPVSGAMADSGGNQTGHDSSGGGEGEDPSGTGGDQGLVGTDSEGNAGGEGNTTGFDQLPAVTKEILGRIE